MSTLPPEQRDLPGVFNSAQVPADVRLALATHTDPCFDFQIAHVNKMRIRGIAFVYSTASIPDIGIIAATSEFLGDRWLTAINRKCA